MKRKDYWTPERKEEQRKKMQAINAKKKQAKIQAELDKGGTVGVPQKKKVPKAKIEAGQPIYTEAPKIRHGGAKLDQADGTLKLNIQLSEKQAEAFRSPVKFLMYGGAKGGGKSWFACCWMFLMAVQNRGNKLFFCRRRSVDFTNTTLETWKKCIPSNLYRINEQKKKIYIDITKSVIDYGGLDDPMLIQSLNSAEYGHICIDQAEEIEQDSFAMIRGTLRHRLADGSEPDYKIRLTANPAQCWLKDMFILRPAKDCAYIPALPSDNPHLPKGYVDNMKEAFKHRPHLLAAYIDGSWDDLSGNDMIIRGKWLEEAKNRKPFGDIVKKIVVNDPAITGDENICFLMAKYSNGAIKIEDELIIEHQRPFETAARLAQFRRNTKAQVIAVDSIGIGAGVIDGLIQLEEPYLAINSSSRPTLTSKQVRFQNMRSQMWWETSEAFAENKVILDPSDYELASQLGSVKFDPSGVGKLLVEAKVNIKKRIGRSPDRADAFVMGVYALGYVNNIGYERELQSSTDRQGSGELVGLNDENFVKSDDDFSGYNF